MGEYVKLFVGMLRWLVVNLIISPFLKRYFEAPLVGIIEKIFGDRVPEDDVESAGGGSAGVLDGSVMDINPSV